MKKSCSVNYSQIALFIALSITFMGYILRWVFPLNIEIWLGVILIFTIYMTSKNGYKAISKPILIWLLLMALFWGGNVGMSLWHDSNIGGRTLSLISTYSTVFGFGAIAVLIGIIRPSIDFFWYLMAMGVVVILLAFGLELNHVGLSAINRGHRFGGYTSQSISFGVFSNIFFIILLGSLSWAFKKGKIFLLFWMLLLVADFCMIIFSHSRNAWMGLPEAVIVWSFYYGFKLYHSEFSKHKKLIVFITPFIIIMSVFSFKPFQNIVDNRVALTISSVEGYFSRDSYYGSVGVRLLMYEAALPGIEEYFWFGVGTENFPAFLKEETQRVSMEKFDKEIEGFEYSSIHNQFLMSWLMHGVFAFLSVLAFFIFMFRHFYKGMKDSSEEYKPIWIAGLVYSLATLISFLPESMLHSLYNFSHFFMVSSILIAFTATLPRPQDKRSD